MELNDNIKDHILDSIAEGVFTVDGEFKIIFFNKAAERITGFSQKDVVGKYCKDIFQTKRNCSDCPLSIVFKTNKNLFDFETTIKTNENKAKPIKLNAAVLYNNDKPSGGIISFRDFSKYETLGRDLQKESQFHGMIGRSKAMKDVFILITEIADSDAPVFIRGESGTGKELVANAIQKLSHRRDYPFIKINCSVFPPNLLASELFGHVKGAFTDAVKERIGRFEMADKGIVFLDEVAEMPLSMQVQLLRILQEGTFERIGESVTRHTDVQVIAATNVNIKEALATGKFRDDLFYRLNVIPIELTPLRERKEDIVPLIKHFLKKFSLFYKKAITDIEGKAVDILLEYPWPGNIRELENAIEYSFVRTTNSNIIEATRLPQNILDFNPLASSEENTAQAEGEYLKKDDLLFVLEKHKWNKSKVAKELNIGRTTLWRKMKQLGIGH